MARLMHGHSSHVVTIVNMAMLNGAMESIAHPEDDRLA